MNDRYQELHSRFFVFNPETGLIATDMAALNQQACQQINSLETIVFDRLGLSSDKKLPALPPAYDIEEQRKSKGFLANQELKARIAILESQNTTDEI
jgi:hypothetical protein